MSIMKPEYQSAEWWRQYRQANAARLRAYKRNYDSVRYKTHPDQEHARRNRWKQANPLKVESQRLANNAQRRGELVKQPCEKCGSINVSKHHDDYTKPLEVRWLCHVHHAEANRIGL